MSKERPFKFVAELWNKSADENHIYSKVECEFTREGLAKYLRDWADSIEETKVG